MIFDTARQAFAWMACASRGPRMAKLQLGDRVQETRHVDDRTLGRLLAITYGPRDRDCCGLRRGSVLETDLIHWAVSKAPSTPAISAFAKRFARRLRRHGMKREYVPRGHRRTDVDEDTGEVRRSTHIDETKPTERQADCLEAVIDLQRTRGIPPTLDEIIAEMGLRSKASAVDHLSALESKGWVQLVRDDAGRMVARGIRVLGDPTNPYDHCGPVPTRFVNEVTALPN